jgi:serine protease inhibitor
MGSIEGKSTTVEMGSTPASRYIRFDKPFIFLIMDNQESVPLFIGSFAKFE